MLPALLTITVPLTLEFTVAVVPPRNPAVIPEGSVLMLVRMVPELMVARFVTSINELAVVAVA